MRRNSVRLFLGTCLAAAWVLLSPLATAQQAEKPVIGTVWRLQGNIEAQPQERGPSRKLLANSPIYAGETIRAAANGEALLKMQDAGLIAIRPNAAFVVERFAAQGKAEDHQVIKLLTGSLRILTGWIGKLNRAEHKVITPQATIGIRGTDHEPYVLGATQAAASKNLPGTYNKVNSGATTLSVDDNALDIDPGRVGFVRDTNAPAAPGERRTRALITLLLPVLLDKIPDFYVPGSFEGDIDQYAAQIEQISRKALEERQNPPPLGSAPESCDAQSIAQTWLGQFDQALTERNADALIAMLAPEVSAKATIRTKDNKTRSIDFTRDEVVSSTLQAIQSLADYSHRRLSLTARMTQTPCQKLRLRSLVLEQGKLSGKPYHFESVEEFELERIDGRWLAVRMETTQR